MLRSGLNGPQAGRSIASTSHVTGIIPPHIVKIQGCWRRLQCVVRGRLGTALRCGHHPLPTHPPGLAGWHSALRRCRRRGCLHRTRTACPAPETCFPWACLAAAPPGGRAGGPVLQPVHAPGSAETRPCGAPGSGHRPLRRGATWRRGYTSNHQTRPKEAPLRCTEEGRFHSTAHPISSTNCSTLRRTCVNTS
jgi:hypothetical protein